MLKEGGCMQCTAEPEQAVCEWSGQIILFNSFCQCAFMHAVWAGSMVAHNTKGVRRYATTGTSSEITSKANLRIDCCQYPTNMLREHLV